MKKSLSRLRRASMQPGPEASPYDAKTALQQGGDVTPFADYVLMLQHALTHLAGKLDTLAFANPTLKNQASDTSPQPREDWEGNYDQVLQAIDSGSVNPIRWFLEDAAEVLSLLHSRVIPPADGRGSQLEFVRKGRGRPPRAVEAEMFETGKKVQALRSKTHKYGKQEAAIADFAKKPGHSRATLMRVKKQSRTKNS